MQRSQHEGCSFKVVSELATTPELSRSGSDRNVCSGSMLAFPDDSWALASVTARMIVSARRKMIRMELLGYCPEAAA